MNRNYLLIVAFLSFAIMLACSENTEQKASDSKQEVSESELKEVEHKDFGDLEKYREQGNEIVARTFSTLSSNLQKAMKEGGVTYALEFCNVQAYPLTDSIADLHNVSIKRTSHKVRNPDNKPNDEERQMLDEFLTTLKNHGEYPEPEVHKSGNKIHFYAPITLAPQCTSCHGKVGEQISEENYDVIKELYPDDEATGFKPGEIRGMWSLTFNQ